MAISCYYPLRLKLLYEAKASVVATDAIIPRRRLRCLVFRVGALESKIPFSFHYLL